jgi:phage baseplate assembly protein W
MDIKFPLVENDISVFERADSLESARQKLKNIVLTNPGERVMLPKFGIGIKRYLFEQNSNNTISNFSFDVNSKLSEQVRLYAPNLQIASIELNSQDNIVKIKISYIINNAYSDVLEIVA